MVKIFADDTKIYSKIESVEDNNKLQESINSLINWSDKWLIKFKVQNVKYYTWGVITLCINIKFLKMESIKRTQ